MKGERKGGKVGKVEWGLSDATHGWPEWRQLSGGGGSGAERRPRAPIGGINTNNTQSHLGKHRWFKQGVTTPPKSLASSCTHVALM
jgi:hypothetical protein